MTAILALVFSWCKSTIVSYIPTILQYWKYILAVIVIIGVWWYWHSLQSDIASLTKSNTDLKTSVTQITTDRDQWKSNFNQLHEVVSSQTEQMKKLSKAADDTTTKFTALQGTVSTQVGTINNKLSQIASKNMSNMTCDQAIDDLKQNALAH